MKKNYFLFIVVMLMTFGTSYVNAQHFVVNQVIVGSGGSYSNPDDFVSMASYKPASGVTTTFGNIQTQSIQDVVINDGFAYVAAQDSIAKFNIDTYERVAITEAMGVNRLFVTDDILIASFQFPITENFVKVYSSNDLSLIANVSDVSDEAAGITINNNLAYVAVPGGWASTVGKIAIIDLNDYSLIEEINFNEQGIGVYDMFLYNSKIMAVCRTPWGASTANLLSMNSLGTHTDIYPIDQELGKMVGEIDGLLFTVMNGGIGIIDLTEFTVTDTAFIEASVLPIAAATLDTIDGNFYITTTDFSTIGVGTIYDALGIESGSFDAGISADALAIDYRDNTGIDDLLTENKIVLFPNPASESISVSFEGTTLSNDYKIVDVSGRVLKTGTSNFNSNTVNISINSLESGLYFLVLSDNKMVISSPFVKK